MFPGGGSLCSLLILGFVCYLLEISKASAPIDAMDHEAGFHVGDENSFMKAAVVHHRVKRKVKEGDIHLIEAFRKVPGNGLKLAETVLSNVSAKACALYCLVKLCPAWSYHNVTKACRVGCQQCNIAMEAVSHPEWDFYSISVAKLAATVFSIDSRYLDFTNRNLPDNKVYLPDDPTAPGNVLVGRMGRDPVVASAVPTSNTPIIQPLTVTQPITNHTNPSQKAAVVHQRVKRKVKEGDIHLIEAFQKVPGNGLKLAETVLSNVSAKDCASYCLAKFCPAWSYHNVTKSCRVGCRQCDIPMESVSNPEWDFYSISLATVAATVFSINNRGLNSTTRTLSDNQIYKPDDPTAPENVLEERIGEDAGVTPAIPILNPSNTPPGNFPSSPTTAPATPKAPPPRPPPTLEPETSSSNPSSTDSVTSPSQFPVDCGLRPVFGLLDNARRLRPDFETTRVVGGTEASQGSYPWQVEILVADRKGFFGHSCGGVVISPDLILTAAHCHTRHERGYEVKVGQHDLERFDAAERTLPVQNIVIHQHYRPNLNQGYRNDIALIRLFFTQGYPQEILFNDYVQPACLPAGQISVRVGQVCQVSGWGLTSPDQALKASSASRILRGATIPILNSDICQRAYGKRFDNALMICAGYEDGGTDSCQGDSGGPLSCRDNTGRWFVAGIVSFGSECGKKGFPGVYTRISAFRQWIEETSRYLTSP